MRRSGIPSAHLPPTIGIPLEPRSAIRHGYPIARRRGAGVEASRTRGRDGMQKVNSRTLKCINIKIGRKQEKGWAVSPYVFNNAVAGGSIRQMVSSRFETRISPAFSRPAGLSNIAVASCCPCARVPSYPRSASSNCQPLPLVIQFHVSSAVP